MFVIPTGTDAPIYHWPYATVGLIILNVLLLFLVPAEKSAPQLDENGDVIEETEEPTNFERYALTLGDGRLHPVQWVTHNFLHMGLLHLAGNMLFLWSFGIVVEGKLGVVKYLLMYLAIGTLHGAMTQILLMKSGMDTNAAGASAVIYGLLATCMIWAPRNELNCLVILIVVFRTIVFQWDLYYTTVAMFYVCQEAFWFILNGSIQGKVQVSEMGHLSGAFWGGVVAIVLLKGGLVDCEGWDLFSLWAKRRKLAKDWKLRAKMLDRQNENLRRGLRIRARAKSSPDGDEQAGTEPASEDRSVAAMRRVKRLIDEGAVDAAVEAYNKSARSMPAWPSQSDLYALIKALHACGAEPDSVRLMRDHCRRYPDKSTKMRLKLAQILLLNCQRPAAALRVLQEIPPGSLAGDLEKARQMLTAQASHMREEGVLELEGHD
jgi:membrane associated rhomboid family serine protease